jgi:signal transduction histidine kinase
LTLYIPAADGWDVREWAFDRPLPGADWTSRFPLLTLDGEAISEKTIYLRVQAAGSLRASIWLQPEADFLTTYAEDAALFVGLLGLLAGIAIYLFTIGITMREGALVSLAAVCLSYMLYVTGERALFETMLVPGAIYKKRVLSFGGTFLILASSIAYVLTYLHIGRHFPRLARAGWLLAAVLVAVSIWAAYEAYTDDIVLRRFSSYIGIASLAAVVGFAVISWPFERARSLRFFLCWVPAIAAGIIRLGLDAYPRLGGQPVEINATFFTIGLSLVVFAVMTSLDLQRRESQLRAMTQASEERFRSFAASASDSFWESDADGMIVFGTGPASTVSGLLPGVSFLDNLTERSTSASRASLDAMSQAVRTGHPFRSVALLLTGESGDPRQIAFSGTPIYDETGVLQGFRGIATDTTDERNRREREAQQQKMVAVGQLAGGIAHEVNNLLHPMINLSRRVANQLPSIDEKRRYLDIVVDAGVRAAEIVAAVLSSVRPTFGEGETAPFAEAVHRASETIKTFVPGSIDYRVSISVSGGPSVPAGEMLQLLTNLVTNAIHATKGSGRIDITLDLEKSAGEALCTLSVGDSGQGMDEETRRRALDPFFTTKEVGEGTGLGLSVVYGIVRSWNGMIEIQSAPGVGSRVDIRVPWF